MPVISFRDTILYKRGFLLSAAATVAAVAAPWVVDGSIFREPIVHVAPLVILLGFLLFCLRKAGFFSIADEVIDHEDRLTVRRGRAEAAIPLAAIASAEVITDFRMHRICIHLRESGRFGSRIDFWPRASLWGNLNAVQQVAAGLAERARNAGGGRNPTG